MIYNTDDPAFNVHETDPQKTEEIINDKIWLNTFIEPFDLIERKWINTYPLRKNYRYDSSSKSCSFLKEWSFIFILVNIFLIYITKISR